MKKRFLVVIIAVVILCASLFCGIYLIKKSKIPTDQGQSVSAVMIDNTMIEISNVQDVGDGTFIADVKVIMPDILAIYNHLLKEGKADGMDLDEICAAVSEHATDTDYLSQHSLTASVHKESSTWVLASDDCVEALFDEMVNDLFVQIINDVGAFEIETEDDFVWEGTQ